MRILLGSNLPYLSALNGASKGIRWLLEGLARSGHEVSIVAPGIPETPDEQSRHTLASNHEYTVLAVNDVEVHAVPDQAHLQRRLAEQISAFQPEAVIISCEDPSHRLLKATLTDCGSPIIYLVQTIQYLPFGPQSFFPGPQAKRLVEQCDVIVANSRFAAQYIQKCGGIRSHAINMCPYAQPPLENLSCFDDGFVTMVNPCDLKGLPIFLALARLFPEVQFAAVPSWGTTIENRAALNHLSNVHLLEPNQDFDQILMRSRTLIMPSLWQETFGNTVVDSMLRGIPVMASNVGGLIEAKLGTEFVLPVRPIERFSSQLSGNGLPSPIVPDQDVAPWCDALSRLLSDRSVYERESALERDAATKFVSSLSVEPFEELLDRIVSAPIHRRSHKQTETVAEEIQSGSLPLSELTPDQRALLMMRLRSLKKSRVASGMADSSDSEGGKGGVRKVSRSASIPLSFAQERLWFLDQLEPDSPAYNIPLAFRLSGPLNSNALRLSLSEIVRRHEALRTSYPDSAGEPIQTIGAECEVPLEIFDLSHLDQMDREAEVSRCLKVEAHRLFNLARGPMIRASLLRLEDNDHVLLITMHHISSDAWSLSIFFRELSTLYEARLANKTVCIPELSFQPADFAVWQKRWMQGETLKGQIDYWKQRLDGAPPVLDLHFDRPRPAIQTWQGARESMALSEDILDKLQNVCRQERVTLFMLLLAAFQTLLNRYTQQDDIVIGIPIAGRNHPESHNLIGFFLNTLVIRTDLSGDPTFRELISRVRHACIEAYDHQDVPFEKLVQELQPERNLSRSPLFQVSFNMNNDNPMLELAGLTVRPMEVDSSTSKFDLTLTVTVDNKDHSSVSTNYNTALFNADTIMRMINHFHILLESITSDPVQKLSHLSMLSDREKHSTLVEWNNTDVDRVDNVCLHQLFEVQVKKTPDAIALITEDGQLTYEELNRRSNRLACRLQEMGVGPERLVGICMERSQEMVVALLAVLKSGGAYVPIDPEYPQERIAYMIEDSKASIILTNRPDADYPIDPSNILCLNTDHDLCTAQNEESPKRGVEPDNLTYLIYTSGSTGQPKGVQITHRSLVNLLLSMKARPGMSQNDVFLAVTTLSFDIAALELFLPLITGARLVIASSDATCDGNALSALISSSNATAMQATPSTWRMLLLSGWQGSEHLKILCGGEALSRELADELLKRGASVWNLYGPTETTIWSMVSRVQNTNRDIHLGSPIDNTQVYLLDRRMNLVPVGVLGEMFIGGEGLARGYWNQPELTAERFVRNPFSHTSARLYKTGDFGRYRADGNIEFLGRDDLQVKVRGHRIELSEIESVLRKNKTIHDAIVAGVPDASGISLAAYVIPEPGHVLSVQDLRSYLGHRLPAHMIPSAFVALDEFPLTPNGKVDRKQLPPPGQFRIQPQTDFVAPRTPIESTIAAIWASVLDVERVGINDDFFELGGHSLLATKVISRMRSSFSVDLALRILFESPTVAGLALWVTQRLAEESGMKSFTIM